MFSSLTGCDKAFGWRAPLASSVVGSALDTALFFTIAFSASITLFPASANEEISWAWEAVPLMTIGGLYPLWVSLAIADWMVKMTLALIALIPFPDCYRQNFATLCIKHFDKPLICATILSI